MEKVILKAEKRDEKGKIKVKKMRREGLVPAICYKDGKEGVDLKINARELYHALHTKAGENVLITLKISGVKTGKEKTVIIKEIQSDPLQGEVLHIDFNEISLTEEIKVKVPLATHGEAEAVIKEDGIVEHVIWEIEVECLPTQIPERLTAEIADLKIGDSIHIKDLVIPPGVKVLMDPEQVIITAKPPAKAEVKEEVPDEAEMLEPEVIAKGKKPEEGEELEVEGADKAAEKEDKKSE